MTPLPSTLRAQALTSLYGEITAVYKKAEIEATASSSSPWHSTKTLKPTSSAPSHSKTSITKAIPTVMGGVRLNNTASGGTNNSTTSAPTVTSTTQTVASDSATKDADVALSTLEPSSTSNVGMIQPTAVLKSAGALAVGVAGMIILL